VVLGHVVRAKARGFGGLDHLQAMLVECTEGTVAPVHVIEHPECDGQHEKRLSQKMASGCAGAPVLPMSRMGAALKKNS